MNPQIETFFYFGFATHINGESKFADEMPLYSIYGKDPDEPMKTARDMIPFAGPINGTDYLYVINHPLHATDGFERGKTYMVDIRWKIGGKVYTQQEHFTVT